MENTILLKAMDKPGIYQPICRKCIAKIQLAVKEALEEIMNDEEVVWDGEKWLCGLCANKKKEATNAGERLKEFYKLITITEPLINQTALQRHRRRTRKRGIGCSQ